MSLGQILRKQNLFNRVRKIYSLHSLFFLIIIFGYVNIFMDLGYRRQKRIKGVERYEDSMERKKSDKEEFIDWNDFRDNLKKTLQDIPKNIKESLESKEEKKKPKRKRNE